MECSILGWLMIGSTEKQMMQNSRILDFSENFDEEADSHLYEPTTMT